VSAPHPDAIRVMDADEAHPDRLRLTRDEAEAIALEASYLLDDHGGGYLRWVDAVLRDIRHGARDRNGRLR